MTDEIREKVARIIDPEAFEAEIRLIRKGYAPGKPTLIRVDAALAKASAILALVSPPLGDGSDANAHLPTGADDHLPNQPGSQSPPGSPCS